MIAPTMNADVKPSTSASGTAIPCGDGVLGARRRDRGERRDAERAADLLRGVDQARRQPGLGRLDPGQRGDRDRHEREPDPDPDQQEAGQQVADVGAADRHLREVQQARGQHAIPTTSTGFTPTRVTSCAATADQMIAVPATAR